MKRKTDEAFHLLRKLLRPYFHDRVNLLDTLIINLILVLERGRIAYWCDILEHIEEELLEKYESEKEESLVEKIMITIENYFGDELGILGGLDDQEEYISFLIYNKLLLSQSSILSLFDKYPPNVRNDEYSHCCVACSSINAELLQILLGLQCDHKDLGGGVIVHFMYKNAQVIAVSCTEKTITKNKQNFIMQAALYNDILGKFIENGKIGKYSLDLYIQYPGQEFDFDIED